MNKIISVLGTKWTFFVKIYWKIVYIIFHILIN